MDTEDWVSITEAANRLTATGDVVDRSTLSRYLKQHGEALQVRPDGKSNLVEFGALAAHRRENIRLRPISDVPMVHGKKMAPPRFQGSQSESVARKALADAEWREMDLAKRRGQLTLVDEVDRGGRDAIALMQSAFEQAVEAEAASLALKYAWDERTIRVALKTFARRGIEVFNREVLKRIEEMRRGEGVGDPD